MKCENQTLRLANVQSHFRIFDLRFFNIPAVWDGVEYVQQEFDELMRHPLLRNIGRKSYNFIGYVASSNSTGAKEIPFL